MNFFRHVRNDFFNYAKQNRIYRIIFCAWVIAIIWTFADLMSGSFEANYWHDLLCLALGIVAERLIPWGKTGEAEKIEELLKENKRLNKEVNNLRKKFQQIYEKAREKKGEKV